jgi:hypothetical protein
MKNKPFEKTRRAASYKEQKQGTETRLERARIPDWVTPKMLVKVTPNGNLDYQKMKKSFSKNIIPVSGPFVVLVVGVASDRMSMDVLFGEELGRIHASKKEYELEVFAPPDW